MSVKTEKAPKSIEHSRGAGFSDWQRVAKETGHYALAAVVGKMDLGETVRDGKNAHRAIAERLANLELPVHSYVAVSLGDFLLDPERHIERLADGDYFFASIVPGVHIAHGETVEEVVEFVRQYVCENPTEQTMAREMYLSRNGEPVMSGHIMIKDDGNPNSIYAEFTNGNFNMFHRGFHGPEIVCHRTYRSLQWEFLSSLATDDGDWRDDQLFVCNGDVKLSRPAMAQKAYDALSRIPHDGDAYLPGYYEVLIEKTGMGGTRPVFIEAVLGKNF